MDDQKRKELQKLGKLNVSYDFYDSERFYDSGFDEF